MAFPNSRIRLEPDEVMLIRFVHFSIILCLCLIFYYDICLFIEVMQITIACRIKGNSFIESLIMRKIGMEYEECKYPSFRRVFYKAAKAEDPLKK